VAHPLNRRHLILSHATLGGASVLPGCGGGGSDVDDRRDLVNFAASKPELSVFVEAVGAAGLTDTLKGSGPFTAFRATALFTSSTGCYCRADAFPTDWRTR